MAGEHVADTAQLGCSSCCSQSTCGARAGERPSPRMGAARRELRTACADVDQPRQLD